MSDHDHLPTGAPDEEPLDADAVLRDALRALRAPGRADRELQARLQGMEHRVLAAIAAPAAATRSARKATPWLLRPRTVRLRPLPALAAAAAVLLAAVLGGSMLRPRTQAPPTLAEAPATAPASTPAAVPAPDTVRLVQFVLLAPHASRVEVVGDFNHWQGAATPLHRASAAGLWEVELPLAPGRYTYTFVVDGSRFIPDPTAPRALVDDFGTPSSVITVAGGNT